MARYLLMQEDSARERTAQRRRTREASMYQELPDKEFVNTFRLTPDLFDELCAEVAPLLPPHTNSRGIDPTIKILTALKFFGRGDYQGGVGRDQSIPMSQQAVSRCIKQVVHALNDPELVRRHVRFPQNQAERAVIKTRFYNKFGLPGIVGAIDCTHVALHRPNEHEERFFNRKHFHSLNAQVICDPDNYILNADASYGGATHDSFIWQNSILREHFEDLCAAGERAVLLGDSGYPLREYLLTPVDGAAEDSPEGRFNATQKMARSIIERTFGILKGRWRCLLAARELYYHPEVVGRIIIACSVLHNMCIAARLEPIELEENEIELENEIQRAAQANHRPQTNAEALRRGREARALIIHNLFRE